MDIEKYASEFAARQRVRDALPAWVKLAALMTNIPSFLGTSFLLLFLIRFARSVVHSSAIVQKDPGPAFGAALAAAFLWGIPLGLMAANGITWLIPPLRRAHEHAFADAPSGSFKDAMRQLVKFALVVSPVVLVLIVLAIWDPWR